MKRVLLALALMSGGHAYAGTVEDSRDVIIEHFGVELYEEMLAAQENGTLLDFSIEFIDNGEDGAGGRNGSGNCHIKITTTTGGSAGVGVGRGPVSGNVSGGGYTTTHVDAEVPCDRAPDVIHDIITGGGGRTSGRAPGGNGRNSDK